MSSMTRIAADPYARLQEIAPDLALHCRLEHSANLARVFRAIREETSVVFQPRPTTRPDEFADAHRVMPSSASADPGPYSVATYEVARSAMNTCVEPGVSMLSVMAAIQLCKTNIIECLILYYMCVDPSPVLVLEPSKELCVELSKTKIDGMIEYTEIAKERVYKNTLFRKSYKGGYLAIKSGATGNSVISIAAKATLADETDEMAEINGVHVIEKLENRSESFYDSFNGRVCSPTTSEGFIYRSYMQSDQRMAFVVCPSCGHDHVMKMFPDRKFGDKIKPGVERKCLVWNDDGHGNWDLKSSRYMCPNQACGHVFSEGERLKAIENLRWRQTKRFHHCEEKQDPVENNLWEPLIWHDGVHHVDYALCKHCGERGVSNYHAGYWANRLYTPKALDKLLGKWKKATRGRSAMKKFINDELAEPYTDIASVEYSAGQMRTREETYPQEVPDRVACLTIGIDRQTGKDGYFAYEVVGHGLRDETWSIEYGIIPGDTTAPETLFELDKLLNRDFLGVDGRRFRVLAGAIDTGGDQEAGRQNVIYRFCHDRRAANLFAIKGKSEKGTEVAPIWPKTPTVVGRNQLLHVIGRTRGKNEFMENLAVPKPGPGFCHFPTGREDSWYSGLLAEKQVMKDGVLRWVIRSEGARNEALDCRTYALAALEGLKNKFSDDIIGIYANQLSIKAEITPEERHRFSMKLDDIAASTKSSLEQGRAKPIKHKNVSTRFKPTGKAAPVVAEVAIQAEPSPEQLQSPVSDLGRRNPSAAHGGKMKAPFSLRR